MLADLLWTRYPLQALYSDISEQSADEELEDEDPATIEVQPASDETPMEDDDAPLAGELRVAGSIPAVDRGPPGRVGGHGPAHR